MTALPIDGFVEASPSKRDGMDITVFANSIQQPYPSAG